MSAWKKTRQKLLLGVSDVDVDFESICTMLLRLGFQERRGKGSHRIFFRAGIQEIINLQPIGGKGKAYQMKQIREILLKYKLTQDED